MQNHREAGWRLKHTYAQLPKIFYAEQSPVPVHDPKLVKFNRELACLLGLDAELLDSEGGAKLFSGNELPEGARPIAQAYAGHQFGHFTILGDGRAVLLGEQETPRGLNMDIQLKGSGRTPYSRGGDGRAALGPMLREYIISEAMHGLGIPTTRSLAVVTTGEEIRRETELPGAILTRVASSHLRVGTFQYAAAFAETEELRILADYAIERHYPEAAQAENRYLELLQQVIKRQAALIAKWQHVGFIHGVMNTDNMTISGETIDYGPCAFMNVYDPATVFSSIDHTGRYAYGNQPPIGGWNLARLAEALLPLLDDNEEKALELAQAAIEAYIPQFEAEWLSGMRAKLGLFNEEDGDEALVDELLGAMEKYEADFTNTFLALTHGELEGMILFAAAEFNGWHKRWKERLSRQEQSREEAQNLMLRSNPAVIPRNHRVEEAISTAVGKNDCRVMDKLLDLLADPFAHTPEQLEFSRNPIPTGPYQTFCGT